MKIIVTGGAGFIGSHVVDGLIDEGHNVLVIDNLSTGNSNNLNPKANFENLDITDSAISNIIKSFDPDVISHFAAQTSVNISTNNSVLDANTNIIGTINVFDAMNSTSCRNFIYINTHVILLTYLYPRPFCPISVLKYLLSNSLCRYN